MDTIESGDRGVKGGPKTGWRQGYFTDNSIIMWGCGLNVLTMMYEPRRKLICWWLVFCVERERERWIMTKKELFTKFICFRIQEEHFAIEDLHIVCKLIYIIKILFVYLSCSYLLRNLSNGLSILPLDLPFYHQLTFYPCYENLCESYQDVCTSFVFYNK